MADKHTERALQALRERHLHAALAAAKVIQEYAGYVIRDLENGNNPGHFAHLVPDALELERRMFALDAIKDVTGIYQAEAADKDKPVG